MVHNYSVNKMHTANNVLRAQFKSENPYQGLTPILTKKKKIYFDSVRCAFYKIIMICQRLNNKHFIFDWCPRTILILFCFVILFLSDD